MLPTSLVAASCNGGSRSRSRSRLELLLLLPPRTSAAAAAFIPTITPHHHLPPRHHRRRRSRPPATTALAAHNNDNDSQEPPQSLGPLGRTALLALPGAGLYLAASAAAGFGLEGSVERTLGGAAVACAGLAGAAYGGTLRGAIRGQQRDDGEAAGDADDDMAAFAGFQRSYLAVQLLATFVDFVQGPYLFKVYAGTYALGVVRYSPPPALPSASPVPLRDLTLPLTGTYTHAERHRPPLLARLWRLRPRKPRRRALCRHLRAAPRLHGLRGVAGGT